MFAFFECVAGAVAERGIKGLLAEVVPGGQYLFDIAESALERYRRRLQQDRAASELRAEVEAMAKATYEEVKAAAVRAAAAAAPDDAELRDTLELYLAQIPGAIRQTLKRPADTTGTTVPADFRLSTAEDVVELLPARLPRFRSGDSPPFLKGWVLVEQVGSGGFGDVWKARHRRLDSILAAVKFGHALTAGERAMLHEGDILNRVMRHGKHPGVVELQDAWDDGDPVPWLRFEFMPHGDLTQFFRTWESLAPAARLAHAIDITRGLARTIGFFHRLDPAIVHRDLKPSNVLLEALPGGGGTAYRTKIADFGIGGLSATRSLAGERSNSLSRGQRLHSSLRGSHTPLYASPQQRDGSADPDPRDDVHALGVIAYQMLTGQLNAGAGPDFADDLRAAGVPDELNRLLCACVSAKPERRPADGLALAEALDRLAPPLPAVVPSQSQTQAVAAPTVPPSGVQRVGGLVAKVVCGVLLLGALVVAAAGVVSTVLHGCDSARSYFNREPKLPTMSNPYGPSKSWKY